MRRIGRQHRSSLFTLSFRAEGFRGPFPAFSGPLAAPPGATNARWKLYAAALFRLTCSCCNGSQAVFGLAAVASGNDGEVWVKWARSDVSSAAGLVFRAAWREGKVAAAKDVAVSRETTAGQR